MDTSWCVGGPQTCDAQMGDCCWWWWISTGAPLPANVAQAALRGMIETAPESPTSQVNQLSHAVGAGFVSGARANPVSAIQRPTGHRMRTFYVILGNTLFANVCNFFVWFALTFWMYLETRSVIATSLVGGLYMVAASLSGFLLGAVVDHLKKKMAMMVSSAASALFIGLAAVAYRASPPEAFKTLGSVQIWGVMLLVLGAVIAGNIRSIAVPTLVTLLIPEDERREKANGLSGIVMGISSSGAGLGSGIALAYLGMFWVLIIGTAGAVLAFLHLALTSLDEPAPASQGQPEKQRVDVQGTIAAIRSVPGLFPLIFFTTFNNLLGGVFMALMDAYGLSLVSVQVWSALWGVLSTGFIVGGLYVAKKGLGHDPLRRMFRANVIIWCVSVGFTVQPSIILFAVGILVWTLVMPSIEASEQSVLQKVVPVERQGRVFGFAQSLEMSASPLMAFLIGPIAQFALIPFMTTGKGVHWIGGWFGTGAHRGMALAFIGAGCIGLAASLLAVRSRSYRSLSDRYQAPLEAQKAA
jgi:DHA3 family multidrug efflux protein-like MFS transporter